MMMNGNNLNTYIIKNNLFPCVPTTDFNKLPFSSWKDEKNQFKSEENLLKFGESFKWINKNEEEKTGKVTGYTVLTGEISGIMVIDLDRGHNDVEDGIKEFETILNRINCSDEDRKLIKNTLRVKTPSGGLHLYFKYEKGLTNKAKYFPGVDIRTDGGIIVAPCTIVKKEGKKLKYEVLNDNEIKEMPKSLLELLQSKTKEKEEKATKKKEKIKKEVTKSKFFKQVAEGERNQALISFLGMMLHNPSLRSPQNLLPVAHMYNQTYISPMLTDAEVEETAMSVLRYEKYPYTDGKGNIIPNLLANYLMEEYKTITLAHNVFRYNDFGYYELVQEHALQKEIFDLIPKAENKTTIKVTEVIKQIKVFTKDTEGKFDKNRLRYINCLNGIYDIEEDEFINHTSDIVTNVQIQAHYKENWKEEFENSRFYKEYLPNLVKEETFRTIQQCIGTSISPHNKKLQGMWALIGDGKNGKSIFCDLLIKLIGKDFITSIGLQELEEDKFITATLTEAVANINPDDQADELKHTATFKKITAGDQIMIQKKGVDSEKFTPNVTMVHGFNRMPHSRDKSDGYARRWFPIPFKNSFGSAEEVARGERDIKKNPQLIKYILENEMDLIFMWGIDGLKDFLQTDEVYLSDECLETLKDYRLAIDNVRDFVENNFTVTGDPEHVIPFKDLYEDYKDYCYEENIAAHKKKSFSQQLEQIPLVEKKKSHGDIKVFGLVRKEVSPF